MNQKPTRDMDDYLNDYEAASRDYEEMGPMWAELVFPDDFEALKTLYKTSQNGIQPEPKRNFDSLKKRSS